MIAPLPEDEQERLKVLRSLAILDTPPEQEYDDITMLASHICGTPISLLSLVDSNRQWFKSRVGLSDEEIHRDQAFCAHAILDREIMVVADALLDRRFAENLLVLQDPKIRFYAGVPLTTQSGHALGTLCIIDRVPRRLTPFQEKALNALARQVIVLLEMRLISTLLDQTNQALIGEVKTNKLLQARQVETIAQLEQAVAHIKRLEGFIPICASCKSIQDKSGRWVPLETYINDHTDAKLSHGYCPDCMPKYFPNYRTLDRPPHRSSDDPSDRK